MAPAWLRDSFECLPPNAWAAHPEEIYGKPTAPVLRYGTRVQKALVLVIIYKPQTERHDQSGKSGCYHLSDKKT